MGRPTPLGCRRWFAIAEAVARVKDQVPDAVSAASLCSELVLGCVAGAKPTPPAESTDAKAEGVTVEPGGGPSPRCPATR